MLERWSVYMMSEKFFRPSHYLFLADTCCMTLAALSCTALAFPCVVLLSSSSVTTGTFTHFCSKLLQALSISMEEIPNRFMFAFASSGSMTVSSFGARYTLPKFLTVTFLTSEYLQLENDTP